MVKKTTTRGSRSKKLLVSVSRFGEDAVAVELAPGSTVADALEKADVELDSTQKVFVSGEEVTEDDEIEMGDILSIVTPKAAGSR